MESEHEVRGLVEVAVSGGVPGCSGSAGGCVGLSWPGPGGVASGSVGRVAFGPVGFVVLVGSLPLVARVGGVGFRFRHLHQGDRVRSC